MIKGLLIETSSENCSVGISVDGELIFCIENDKDFRHAEYIHVFIQNCLNACNLKLSDFHYIGIGTGPGSYTGLRIGYATAKSLAYALNISLVGIFSSYSVWALATMEKPFYDKSYVMLDAGRMEVYLSVHDAMGNFIQDPIPYELNENFLSKLHTKEKILLAGSGVYKILPLISHLKNIHVNSNIQPSVKGLNRILFEKYQNNETLDVYSCEPDYLKEYQFKKTKPT